MIDELDKPLKYVIFAILYIQIFSFMFHPKIKVQMLICVLVLTAIAAISIVYDIQKTVIRSDTNKSTLFTPTKIGWFIGFIGLINLITILLVTKIEYKSDASHKLSNKNTKKLRNVKIIFISIVVSVAIMGIISFFFFGGTFDTFIDADFSIFKNINAFAFLATYVLFASIYTLYESRMLHKLFVNNLIAN